MLGKRGRLLLENIIFLVLNAAFFVILLIFIFSNSQGRLVYEQAYAKQIALLIDEAKPTTTISLNMRDALDFAEKNKIANRSKIVNIDEENKGVIVKLGSGTGYVFKYFSDAKVSGKFKDDYFLISVEEK